MSYDVLDELLRRLVGLRDTARDERRSGERRSAGRSPAASPASTSLVADGGDRSGRDDDEHLRDLPDGAGCTEIWEHLSERQAEEGGANERGAVECRADD